MKIPILNSTVSTKSSVDKIVAPQATIDGDAFPRTVIRGESSQTRTEYRFLRDGTPIPIDIPVPRPGVSKNAALTDWLNVTFPLTNTPESLSEFFKEFNQITGERFWSVIERPGGLHGWKRSYKFGDTSAMFAIGGQNGTAFISLPGEACALFTRRAWLDFTHLMNTQYKGKITRWDGAVDDFGGEHSVDWAVGQYQAGEFSTGGNKPSCCQHGNWICPDGRGRTFEVGKRKNGKMIRTYEKGKQLGDANSPWVRWELELHSKDREIPWDVLVNIGGYVAGAYAVMTWVTEDDCRIATLNKTAEISYEHLVG
ncbi:replication initiation factor domain-containing protein [Granulosicoccus antarcticus]|nr:replication initiation factor domain-containing protein [Granulosicoccus antarcticus]